MYFRRKLKQDFNITGFIPALICLFIGAVIWALIGPKEALLSVAAFFILYAGFSFWAYIRTRNLSYLAASLWQMLVGFFFVTRPKYPLILAPDLKISEIIVVLLLAATVWLVYLLFTKQAKWKGREVFELASITIEPQPDGFTERPRPAGKTNYSKDELMGFAEFLSRNLIAMPYLEENRIVLVPVKMDDEFNYMFKPEKFRHSRSWIAFDFQGKFLFHLPFPTAESLSVSEIMRKSCVDDANIAEIIDIIDVLIEYGVIEKSN